jgi:hypothetical protein
LQWKMLVYFMVYIMPFGIFSQLRQEKSGNPVTDLLPKLFYWIPHSGNHRLLIRGT